MYRTDKQFMKNPATASQRIYIGGLPTTVVADDLELKFRQHGRILGIVLQRGFAFIQFETDEEAQNAIRMEQGTIIHGKKIIVKPALPDRNRGNLNTSNPNSKPQESPNQQKTAPNNQSIGNANTTAKKIEPEDPPKTNQPPEGDGKSPSYEEQELEMIAEKFQESDKQQEFPPKPQSIISSENYDDEDSRGQMRKRGIRGRRGKPWHDDRFLPHPPPLDRDRFMGNVPYCPPERYPEFDKPLPMMDRPERNDCEIIVVSKMLTEYAEYIESRLKSLGLIVDLLFPNEDVPIGRVLANISSRGCLYAILVMPQNKDNQSLTLNVLHGIPQEHRNMPVDDALLFITRNFEAYMRGEKIIAADNESQMTIYDKHPTAIQLLLNMLAENRLLTSVQYDKVLKYLEERRELQVQFELSEGIDVGTGNQVNKQAELQNRIMNILNKSSDNTKIESEQGPPPTSSTSTPLLKDPTVQKALDSLLSGEMFKNIAT
ncbi:nuclear receptor coactivator 5 [Coccinella septempunctata]|uniref:nuclear receptor coactivator 5 n=1 Tax=Coccinella septempunctata TaxID=41139 RepID=UPI001D067138|nr:nuclear receptor coactivator 5 [Coccinella septempunctata]